MPKVDPRSSTRTYGKLVSSKRRSFEWQRHKLMFMLRCGYIPQETYHIRAMMAPLAQQLHCVMESDACEWNHVLEADSRDAGEFRRRGTRQRVQQLTI
jgi:hypothetical protein